VSVLSYEGVFTQLGVAQMYVIMDIGVSETSSEPPISAYHAVASTLSNTHDSHGKCKEQLLLEIKM